MNTRSKKTTKKTTKIVIFSALGTLLIIIAVLAFLTYWRGSTKDIEAVANRLQVPTAWSLNSELIKPPAFMCLDGGTCPELSRSWKIDGILSRQQFLDMLDKSRLHLIVDSDCVLPENIFGTDIPICSAAGSVDGYSLSLSLLENSTTHQQQLVINVRPMR